MEPPCPPHSTDHLPWAIKAFKCEKAWRFWSELEPGVHTAVYRFADKANAALAGDEFKALVADGGRHPHARRGDAGRGAGGVVAFLSLP